MTDSSIQTFRGSAYILTNTLCLAVLSVMAHDLLRDLDTVAFTLSCFIVVVAATLLLRIVAGRSVSDLWVSFRSNCKQMVLLNVTTGVYWVAYFIAVKIATAPFANSLMVGIAPISAFILSSPRSGGKAVYACLIAGLLGVLSWWYLDQGVSRDDRSVYIAIAMGVLAGVGVGAASISMKALASNGMPILDVIALRYWATISITLFGICLSSGPLQVTALVGESMRYGWFGIVFVMIPALLVQKGIRLISAFMTCVIASSAPALTYLVSVLAGHPATALETISYSLLSLLLVRIGTLRDD